MIKNYIKTAIRNLKKHRLYSIINVIGLIIGLSVSIMIIIFVKNELSYDKFHANSENIYRLGTKQEETNKIRNSAITSPPMGPDIVTRVPEVKDQVRLRPYKGASIQYKNENFTDNQVVFAGESFFNIFSFDLLIGRKKEVLNEPNSVVLSKEMSKKMFGNKNPLGKTLVIHNKFKVTVTGIAENVTQNSHIKYDAVVSFATLTQIPDFYTGWDGNYSFYTYLLVEEGIPASEAKPKIADLFNRKLNNKIKESGWNYEPILEPLKDIYLRSDLLYDFVRSGSIKNVYIFSGVAFFILLIATINFMNISTALSLKRMKEVAIRKVTGATKNTIIRQFLGESLLMSLLALIGALILMEIFLPYFNELFNRDLTIYQQSNRAVLLVVPIFIILIGILAGSYPAFYISRFKPVNIMANSLPGKISGLKIQNLLVLVQFIISI